MLKKLSKQKISDIITYGIVLVAFIVMQILINAGQISSLFEGLMVPLCTYIILAISLNLVVGVLGELSLGHAGFMCVGAFTSAFFSKCMQDTITNSIVRFLIALLIGIVVAAIFGLLIGIPVLRLNGDYLAIVTLAFGEIIKNIVNVLFIGKDSKGFHFSTKDEYGTGWQGYRQWTTGNYRSTERCYILYRIYSCSDYIVYRAEPDPFQRRSCDHGDP